MAVKTEMADISLLLRVRTRRKSLFLFLCPDQSTNLSYSSTVEVVLLMKLIYQPVNFKYMFENKNIIVVIIDSFFSFGCLFVSRKRKK